MEDSIKLNFMEVKMEEFDPELSKIIAEDLRDLSFFFEDCDNKEDYDNNVQQLKELVRDCTTFIGCKVKDNNLRVAPYQDNKLEVEHE